MTKEEIKSLVREKLSTKRIILFGAGIIAEEFYQEYKDELNISHCVSNYEKEWGEGAFLGELDVRKYCREELQENDYIVVCGPIAFRSIELQLIDDGMQMYEDFVESKIAGVIWQNKLIALFYGQCILRDIYKCIIQVPAFDEAYAAVFTQAVKNQFVVANRVLYYLKDICDLYVYTPKILDKDSVYSLSLNELPENCRIVSVSNLTFSLYWPQINDKVDAYNALYLHPYNVERNLEHYHRMYRREDCNINDMVLDGISTKEIVQRLSSEEFYSKKQVDKNRRISLRLVEAAEKNVDIAIGDYIKENYQREMLYQNFIHPNKSILWEYIRRLLQKIGISNKGVDMLEEISPAHIHEGGDVPIYPSVAKHLELEFIEEDTQYEVLTNVGIQLMTFAEYTEYYAEYTRKANELMRII